MLTLKDNRFTPAALDVPAGEVRHPAVFGPLGRSKPIAVHELEFVKRLTPKPVKFVVNTHFLPAEMIALLKRKEKFFAPQFTVTTDFETHRLWVNQPCEHYFTATEEAAAPEPAAPVAASSTRCWGWSLFPVGYRVRDREN